MSNKQMRPATVQVAGLGNALRSQAQRPEPNSSPFSRQVEILTRRFGLSAAYAGVLATAIWGGRA